MMRLAALLVLVAAPVAAAQEGPSFDPAISAACEADGGGAACIGTAARACIEADGHAAAGICWGEEAALWERRIVVAVEMLQDGQAPGLAAAERVGAIIGEFGITQVQDRWEASRDLACDYAGAIGGDRGFGPRWIACRARMAGERALWLEGLTQWID